MKCLNYKQELVDAPADLVDIVFSCEDNHIVWSREGYVHQVRYGLQVLTFDTMLEACKELGYCIRHAMECLGRLDPHHPECPNHNESCDSDGFCMECGEQGE